LTAAGPPSRHPPLTHTMSKRGRFTAGSSTPTRGTCRRSPPPPRVGRRPTAESCPSGRFHPAADVPDAAHACRRLRGCGEPRRRRSNRDAAAATPPRPPDAQHSATSSSTSEEAGSPRRRAPSARRDGYGGGDGPAPDARLAYPPAEASGPAAAGGCHRYVGACGARPRVTVSVAATAVA